MATILLSAAGAAIGGGFGGTVLGLSGAVIGRAVGAALGRAIDQKLLGVGSQSVETGKVDRLRLSSASEGEAVGRLWGRMRMAGQVIWATRFFETQTVQKSGKGTPKVTTTSYSYSVSLALALCEGEILRVGRVWADGIEIDKSRLTMRVYAGTEDQVPDPKIVAVEGEAPAYRGIAYVVIEDLPLEPYGNRVPQFTFEVMRAAQGALVDEVPDLVRGIQAVALIPGTGDYALATTPVYTSTGDELTEGTTAVNENAPGGKTDFARALETLGEELPNCGAVSLVVSWFGDDLRCGDCTVRPRADTLEAEGTNMVWRVSGVDRATAGQVALDDGAPVYGGTPADQSVIEAIVALRAAGKAVTFYPFILMDQIAGNGKTDPWSGADDQPALPWRGRITTSIAPGREGTPDRTAAAEAEVAAFFGAAQPGDFSAAAGTVAYTGPAEWSMRRFILHYAHLCAQAGGVEAFCIGTEMVALTQIRGAGDSFPAVVALRQLAAEVKAILGPGCKVGYAADWSEYFGYQTGEGDRYFHLDPLWADPNIDFVGIDNYMPLSDWRAGEEHLDAGWGSIYNLDYLMANIAGGEGYEWYYAAPEHRDAQIRTPITDEAYGEPWVWRYKDIRGWWENEHFERIGGVRAGAPTAWEPGMKPIWFTEMGCAAIDKGTNQPNKFLDPKSSESSLPYYSDGRRDELVQMQYLRAMVGYWGDAANNPISEVYAGPMVDMSRANVWAWDSRPYPQFPALGALWADAENYARGHWISGRAVSQPLASVVAEICGTAGLEAIDTSGLYGVVRGYAVTSAASARSALQSLMLGYGFEAVERGGRLAFRMRDGHVDAQIEEGELALGEEDQTVEATRAPEAEMAGRVRLAYVEADGDFETRVVEAVFPDETAGAAAGSELEIALTRAQAQEIVERWLSEARVARDGVRMTLAPSRSYLGPGDVVALKRADGVRRYRIDRVEQAGAVAVEAVRIEPGLYEPSDEAEARITLKPFAAPVPVTPVFLDLPLLTGKEDPYAPHLAVTARPWPGSVAVYSASEDAGYTLNRLVEARSVIGRTLTPMLAARPGVWDRGPAVRVKLATGELEAATMARVLNGANVMAIGDGSSDNWEIFQFAEATLVDVRTWDLSLRLRGQLGSDALMPAAWPVGSTVVLLDGSAGQIELAPSARGLARHYRIGAAQRPYDDPSYRHRVEAFSGIGLRPLSPCHLRVAATGAGWDFSWVRRTRIDGDSWDGYDVPLGEAQERYLVRVMDGTAVRREVLVAEPGWSYSSAQAAADGVAGGFALAVAQVSDVYGAGLFASVAVAV
ncbi:host specificity protein [Rhodobacter xanthinilyticus]|uniref:Host specificity protein n=1 Tax=Rhodobacter xanthinilyticus TaxID=1850250 RepID=A0A1D9MBN2_9RHOB|nr:glycoside hydrolase TIM-barrel-like domain-containing protein [Rhodobacter xanthinilyticus]AOZ69272.1 host specificity protein [Rhodobacter xanthinilyticus]